MPPTNRDPFIDPQPGDVVVFHAVEDDSRCEVYLRTPNAVYMRTQSGKCAAPLKDWRKWCRRMDAEVLHAA